ncbi:hypothetical protein GCM10011400_61080 [Paraburkholderia caffeinilytica]|uniref:Uncharacterized protein n=1 Tax=Paraburkholderia caffeinilytica TaxID=1761016 RepID=A0ABQ1NAK6_9BURK|nr:hypothetical protein GCM10011400_61080 [Paraburkholderia caffeinilytica]CAB3802575.1 hypothetical protein LMG28690_05610 [Paraburkholderia caffeinilytica]
MNIQAFFVAIASEQITMLRRQIANEGVSAASSAYRMLLVMPLSNITRSIDERPEVCSAAVLGYN